MRYVVQRYESPTDGVGYWVDIATVEVEPRTKRSTVLKKALAEANIAPGKEPLKLRALDAESAEVHELEPYQPPMEWRL